MEPIRTPFKYTVQKWQGPEEDCQWAAEMFLPARTPIGDPSKPVHFDKNVFMERSDEGFVIRVQTRTAVWHMYESVQLDPGTYLFTPIIAEFQYVSR